LMTAGREGCGWAPTGLAPPAGVSPQRQLSPAASRPAPGPGQPVRQPAPAGTTPRPGPEGGGKRGGGLLVQGMHCMEPSMGRGWNVPKLRTDLFPNRFGCLDTNPPRWWSGWLIGRRVALFVCGCVPSGIGIGEWQSSGPACRYFDSDRQKADRRHQNPSRLGPASDHDPLRPRGCGPCRPPRRPGLRRPWGSPRRRLLPRPPGRLRPGPSSPHPFRWFRSVVDTSPIVSWSNRRIVHLPARKFVIHVYHFTFNVFLSCSRL